MVACQPSPNKPPLFGTLTTWTGGLGRYIRAKQKLIKLLDEQKQAIIHHAVTRGLDPNVRLKPSGVEWLGDIPRALEGNSASTRAIARCEDQSGSGPEVSHYSDGDAERHAKQWAARLRIQIMTFIDPVSTAIRVPRTGAAG